MIMQRRYLLAGEVQHSIYFWLDMLVLVMPHEVLVDMWVVTPNPTASPFL